MESSQSSTDFLMENAGYVPTLEESLDFFYQNQGKKFTVNLPFDCLVVYIFVAPFAVNMML